MFLYFRKLKLRLKLFGQMAKFVIDAKFVCKPMPKVSTQLSISETSILEFTSVVHIVPTRVAGETKYMNMSKICINENVVCIFIRRYRETKVS